MARPTIAEKPLTPAERQRRYRERLKTRLILTDDEIRTVLVWAAAMYDFRRDSWTDQDQELVKRLSEFA